jgi:hypothetical protein
MSWIRAATRRLTRLLALAASFVPGMALAAIVVASSGPSADRFPAGKKLDDDARITLRKGDSVTVLDRHGTKVLRGPGRFNVSDPKRPLPNPAFAILTRLRSSGRTAIGAVRTGEDGQPLSPNLWYVDFARPGAKCLADPANLNLWRTDTEASAQYRIASAGRIETTIYFGKDDALAAWDNSKLPVAADQTYLITNEDGEEVSELTFVILTQIPDDQEGLASVLIDNGCTAQLDLLAEHLSTARR